MEELLDPITAKRDRSGTPLEFVQTSLATLPSLERLAPEEFETLIHKLTESGQLADYHLKLENLLKDPAEASPRQALTSSSAALQRVVEEFCESTGKTGQKQLSLVLTALPDCALSDLGYCLDKDGSQVWAGATLSRQPPCLFINLV
jgi:hypothetical protein